MTGGRCDITKRWGAGLRAGIALAVVTSFVAPRAQGQVFNYIDPPIDISQSGTGSWEPVDVSASVPAGATGVIILEENESSSAYEFGVRKTGSGDEWMRSAARTIRADTHAWFMIGVDSTREFELWQGSSSGETFLLGYTTAGVTFFDNAKNHSLSATGSWEPIDISTDTGTDTAIGAILVVQNTTSGNEDYALRIPGSSHNQYEVLRSEMATMAIVGLDGNEIFDMKIGDTDLDTYVVGYITDGVVFLDPPVDVSLGSTGSWDPIDISAHIGSDVVNGALIEQMERSDGMENAGVAYPGASYSVYQLTSHLFAPVHVDAGNTFEGRIADTGVDFYLVGYTTVDFTKYRSIGTDTSVLYQAGTASISQDAKTVTFSGATLPDNVGVGDELIIDAETFHILSRDSTTQVTVQDAAASTHTNDTYTIKRAYNTIQSWENARDGDLVGENRREVGVCYDDGDFTPGSTITISGSTVDSAHYMMLTVAEGQRHSGVAGSGVLIQGSGHSGRVLVVEDEYTVLEWLAITNFATDAIKIEQAMADGSVLANLLIYNFKAATRALNIRSDCTIRNTVIYDGRNGIRVQDGATGIVENCTIYDMDNSGIDGSSTAAGITVRNSIVVGCTPADMELGCTVNYFDYNMYETYAEFTPSGSNDQTPPANLDNLFVSITAGSEDLHLEPSGHNALDTGLDLSGEFSIDIDGETRSTPWDMGADQGGIAANFRSIGTNTSVIHQTGNASISAGATVVTFGGGASLPTNIGLGDELVIGAETLHIASRDSTTQVTVQRGAAASHSAAAYTIKRAYNDFASWESDRQGDLVGEKRREVGVAYDDSVFNMASPGVEIDGSTTDASHYMKVTVAEDHRHNGTAGSGVVIDGGGGAFQVFDSRDPYTVIEWIEITNIDGDSPISTTPEPQATGLVLQNLIIHNYVDDYGAIRARSSATIRNCVIYDGPRGMRLEDGTFVIENVTVYGCSVYGVLGWSGSSVTVRNTIAAGNGTDFDLQGTVDYFDYNMYSSTSGGFTTGANDQVPPADLDDLFYTIAVGSENLHLEDSGHNAVDTGFDLSSSFNGDIDGDTRSAPWDIGADEVAASPLRMSSGANQTFTAGDPTTAISPITVTDHGQTPVITAVDDIRIRIPAGFNMDWDVFDTSATITGAASAKVSTTVSYEDSDKTLVIDVTSAFAASDAITISGLSFTSFSAASSTDYLDLDVNDDATADATDDKTIEINAAPPAPSSGTPLVSWREVEPGDLPAPASSVAISFDDVTPNVSSDSRNSVSFAHTIGSCSCCTDAIIVVVCVTRGDQECTAVSYGGQALALAISEQTSTDSGNEWITIWYRTNPLPGTNLVDVTYDATESPDSVVALSYFGVDQSSPIGAVASNSTTSSSNPVTVNISTTVDGSVVVGGLGQHGGDTDPHDQGSDITTEHYDIVSGGATSSDSGYAGGEIATTTTGIYTFEWTGNVSDDWAIACVELKPAQ